jgi:heparinase II/III-like protein
MGPREVLWRSAAAGRIARDRVRLAIAPARWNRGELARLLVTSSAAAPIAAAAREGRWLDAHQAIARHLASSPQRFLISPRLRDDVAGRVRMAFPDAAADAASRADRIVAGEYDLLGYRGLRFGGPDWHVDPVHDRRPPRRFWSSVPYLDPSSGDHKVIWEVNRQQHWLALGRAYWLTGDRRYRDHVVAQLSSWLDANPPLIGINWASMLELGLRSLSWIWAIGFFAEPDIRDESPWLVDLLVGLQRQLAHVEQNLSYYFSPNTHLLGEGLALYVAGRTLPDLRAGARWERTGRRILLHEIDRQIAADGGHCERSTHYHRYTLDFYLLALAVARLTRDPVAVRFELAADRLAAAARLLADDEGRFPRIGDDDAGVLMPIAGRPADDVRDSLAIAAALTGHPELRIGAPPEEAVWFLSHPALGPALELSRSAPSRATVASNALPATGYYVSRSRAGDHLVVDGGPHGYANGGHAHADALSLTFTVAGVPLLIDPGTACYTTDPELRDRFRSTALHNTVTVDGRPQSIPLGPFHWSRAADATVRRWHTGAGFDYFEGAHDGYVPIVHRRHVLAVHGDLLIVADLIDGAGRHAAAAHWQVDPRWRVDAGPRVTTLAHGDRWIQLAAPHGAVEPFTGDSTTGLGWYSPVYGRVEPATTLRIALAAAAPFWIVTVFGTDPDNPIVDVEQLPVWAEAGVLRHSAALRILRAASIDYALFADPAPGREATWRVAELETDAVAVCCHTYPDRSACLAAMVGGACVRLGGRDIERPAATISEVNGHVWDRRVR